MKSQTIMLDSIQASIDKFQEKFFLENLEMLHSISEEETFGQDKSLDDDKIFNAIEWILFHTRKNAGLDDFQHKLLKNVLRNDLNRDFTPQKDTRPIHERTDKGREYLTDSIYNLILSDIPTQLDNKQFTTYIKNLIQLRKSIPRTMSTKR